MPRLMYDSTTAADIPADAGMVAGYVDGGIGIKWPDAAWLRFHGTKVRIACFAGTNDGDVLDIETGDATPAQAPGWVKLRNLPMPTLYANRANRVAVEDALWTAGIRTAQMWISTLDNTTAVPPYRYPVIAVQYAGQRITGKHYDLSIVNGPWKGVDDMLTTEAKTNYALMWNALLLGKVRPSAPGPDRDAFDAGITNLVANIRDDGSNLADLFALLAARPDAVAWRAHLAAGQSILKVSGTLNVIP